MTWAAVWCCCATPVEAATNVVVIICCGDKADAENSSQAPASHDECPIAQVRATSIAPLPVVLPSFDGVLIALPDWFSPLASPSKAVAAFAHSGQDVGPPPLRCSLLALHTSLLW
jgi:hypothetical protein